MSWDSNPDPEVTGYRLYYGVASGNYTNSISMGNVMTVVVPGLSSGITYFFAVTAVGVDGQESDFSNEESYRQEFPTAIYIQGTYGGQFMLSASGPAGSSYDIEATQDFATWTAIGAVTIGTGGLANFTDTNAAAFPMRFYRTHATQL